MSVVYRRRSGSHISTFSVGAQREATIFKTRVVDFVGTFVQRNPTSNHIPRVQKALLDVITTSGNDEDQLKHKVAKLVRSGIGQLKEFLCDMDKGAVALDLKDVHTRAIQTQNPEVTPVLSAACHYLVRNLLHSGASRLVLDVYQTSFEEAFTKKRSTFPVKILEDFVKHHPSCAWDLRDHLAKFCSRDVAQGFRRQVQAVSILKDLLQNRSVDEVCHPYSRPVDD